VTEYKNIVTIYTFIFDPVGFVIVAADDAAIPILGYSDESTIPREITNPATKEWFEGYSHEIYKIITNALSNEETLKKWNALLAGDYNKSPEHDVSPLLTPGTRDAITMLFVLLMQEDNVDTFGQAVSPRPCHRS
jgi:hypothetical protein